MSKNIETGKVTSEDIQLYGQTSRDFLSRKPNRTAIFSSTRV